MLTIIASLQACSLISSHVAQACSEKNPKLHVAKYILTKILTAQHESARRHLTFGWSKTRDLPKDLCSTIMQ